MILFKPCAALKKDEEEVTKKKHILNINSAFWDLRDRDHFVSLDNYDKQNNMQGSSGVCFWTYMLPFASINISTFPSEPMQMMPNFTFQYHLINTYHFLLLDLILFFRNKEKWCM